MTKRHADATADISPTDPNHPWVARGYRPEFAVAVRRAPVDDAFGEIAYQQAFLEAAEARSRRVPDPDLYHNSESAREYVKRRDKAIFSAKPRGENPRTSSQPNTPSSASTPNYSAGQLPSPNYITNGGLSARQAPAQPEFGPVLSVSNSSPSNRSGQQMSLEPIRPISEQYRPYHDLPMTLEPKLVAPLGPVRKLR